MAGQAGAAGPRDVAMVSTALTQIPLPAFPLAIVVAAGTTQATATPLTRIYNVVSSGSGGVTLPVAAAVGSECVVINRLSALNIYPPSGGKIDTGAVNAATSLVTASTKRFVYGAAGQWWSA